MGPPTKMENFCSYEKSWYFRFVGICFMELSICMKLNAGSLSFGYIFRTYFEKLASVGHDFDPMYKIIVTIINQSLRANGASFSRFSAI